LELIIARETAKPGMQILKSKLEMASKRNEVVS
jgi:hypothetical protein